MDTSSHEGMRLADARATLASSVTVTDESVPVRSRRRPAPSSRGQSAHGVTCADGWVETPEPRESVSADEVVTVQSWEAGWPQ
jgi:hypothetical protein